MANKTMFTDDELHTIKAISDGMRKEKFLDARIKGQAHHFYLHNAIDSTGRVDLVTESWTMAVVQYLMASGYEIKKKV